MVIFRYNHIEQLKHMIFVAYVKFPCFTCFCIQLLFQQKLLYKIEYQEQMIMSASLARLLYVWLLVTYFIALGKYRIDKPLLLSGQPWWAKRMEFFQQIKTIPWVLSSSHSRTASVARPACISAIVECLAFLYWQVKTLAMLGKKKLTGRIWTALKQVSKDSFIGMPLLKK